MCGTNRGRRGYLFGESGTDVEVRDESEDSKSMKEQELERKEAEKQELEKTGKAAGDQVKSECEGIVSTTPALIQEAESTRSCSLWVRGIGANVKASDLKTLFANCGRVVSAKIFIRRQQPTNAHIGYVTMINTSCAERCVQFFDKADKLKGTQTKSSNVVAASSSGKGAETSKSNHPAAKSCFENRQTTDKKDDSFEDKVSVFA
ncbi:unnamed protein product [Toxocara canis]|uniref:RRM domain-containing protein n=1 Tax=Toxocara canis TaxID=6265 RepID=A0A183VGS7_TOXCA|nr:unnamed protein product [Toxocara canis]